MAVYFTTLVSMQVEDLFSDQYFVSDSVDLCVMRKDVLSGGEGRGVKDRE